MSKYCGKCGEKMAQDEKFCAACGAKFESNVVLPEEKPKAKLTNAVIDNELKNQKHSILEYFGQLLLLILMIVIAVIGNPAILICGIAWIFNVSRMLKEDIRRSKLKYYVLERPCLEKRFVEGDECPDSWQLWFENMEGDYNVAITVEKDFHDATEVGEEFYIVFLIKDQTPCLCYRKSEWTK